MTPAETGGDRDPGPGSFFVLTPGDSRSAELLQKNLDAGGGRAEFVGLGRSMEPLLREGDRVRIVRIEGFLRTGWVVTFAWRGGIVTHRVIRVRADEFWARGDSCADAEGPVPLGDAVGRVVAFRRDGCWHSLEGEHLAILGLAVNALNSGVRRAARRWPRLRRAVEQDLLGSRPARILFGRIGSWIHGEVIIERDRTPERVIAAMVSQELPLSQDLVKDAEVLLAQDQLKMYVARSPRWGRQGRVLLCRARLNEGVATGYISGFLVSVGSRGMGVGGRLLEAAEEAARLEGIRRLIALVAHDNPRSLGAFLAAGYREVPAKELAGRPAEERESVPPDILLLEKML